MGVIQSLIKTLQLLDQQGLKVFKNLKKGYSISSHQILEGIATHCGTFGTIVDVGANQGQFALASCEKFPEATIISFEPLTDLCEKFKKNLKAKEKVSIYNIALGNSQGVIDFYKNEHSHASSALIISEEQKQAIPQTANTTKIQVSIDRLDNILNKDEMVRPILLKLDVQGYEKNVLDGAPKLLKAVDYLVFETSFLAMYEGEPLFDEMHTFLKKSGFELVAPVGFLRGENNVILQMDFLYKNKENFNLKFSNK